MSLILYYSAIQNSKFPSQVGGAFAEGRNPAQFPLAKDQEKGLLVPKNEFAKPILSARSALVKGLGDGEILYEKNPDLSLPIASVTKLMTAMVVEKLAPLDEIVEITPADLDTEAYRANLVSGERIRVRELLKAMLISSANDATLALARGTAGSIEQFVREMNKEASSLGMSSTAFTNPVGFDDAGHYSTAADLSLLVEEFLLHPELLEVVRQKEVEISSVDGLYRHQLRTTNKLILKHGEVVGLKTGYTSEAKGNLIILVDGLHPYYSIILGSPNREAETEKLMNWIGESFRWN